MRKINAIKTLLLLSFTFTTGCVHKPNIEQGNIVTTAQISQLHTGMNENEVRALLGNPVLETPFNLNRLEYVYTLQKGREAGHGKSLSLLFKNHRLVNIKQDRSFTFTS